MSVLLVNAAQAFWTQQQHPKLWQHPTTKMQVLTPTRVLPLQRFSLVRKLNQWLRWLEISKALSHFEQNAPVHFILSDPEDLYLAEFIKKAGFPCYFDWTERWNLYNEALGKASQAKVQEDDILSHVDGVITVSEELGKEVEALGKKHLKLANAVSDEFTAALKEPAQQPELFEGISKPRFLHVGSYNPAWIYWDWLIYAATHHPNISFCMLGGGHAAPDDLPKNIHLLGRVAYEDIPAFMQYSQACMLLYKPKATSGGDPTKLYEYIASGLPIVSSPHPRSMEFQSIVSIAHDKHEFSQSIQLALEEGEQLKENREACARSHSWTERAKVLQHWLMQ
jgi:glycosyltransferase involved in cell wall biosynthesis